MARYFMEVFYKGTNYAGFQVQQNANTVQGELEKALKIFFKQDIVLTGSSRTDAGVHALQNFFHFDFTSLEQYNWPREIYHLNAILPDDIVIREIKQVPDEAHCRFDALSRTYEYSIYQLKNPFLADRGLYYPYRLDLTLLNEAAAIIKRQTDFSSFSKRNTQVKTFDCTIYESYWEEREELLVYHVTGNRFLRGMVRGLVGTMLKVGRGRTSLEGFINIVNSGNPTLADFSVEAQGLSLIKVTY